MSVLRPFWVLLTITLFGLNALADSDLIFPRLSFGSGEFTGLAVVNPNSEPAVVTFTAIGEDGQPLPESGIQNPVEVTVGAGQQFAQIATDVFGPGVYEGAAWVRATSPANDLAGFFLFLTTDLHVFDGADLPETATSVTFNEVRLEDGFSTELNLVNPGTDPAEVVLTLIGATDEVVRELSIPAQGVRRVDVATLFGPVLAAGAGSAPVRYVRASSNTEIAGFEFVKGPGDLLGVNARASDELLETLLFPQLAVLGGVASEVVVVNYSNQTALVTLRAHKPDGSPYGSGELLNNPVARSLGGGEILREDLAELFGFSGTASLEGWLEVVASSPAVNATLSYSVPSLHSVASVAGSREPSRQALFSHIATTSGFFTGVALLNGSELTANVRVVALRPDGVRLGTYDTILLPGQRVSKLIGELIPAADGQAGGFIWVSSDVPLYLTSLFGSGVTGVLANIPPQPVPSAFRPDSGNPRLSLEPLLAILSPASAQSFSLQGGSATSWSVNNVDGGNNFFGTVTNSGLYTAPALVPEDLPVTIAASSGGSMVGGSIDILSAELFAGTAGTPQSVAYLEGAQRVYYSELAVVGPAAGIHRTTAPAGETSTRVVEVENDTNNTLLELPGDEVPKLIPYIASDGQEYLLLAAKISGRVLRLNPRDRQVVEVATGLDQPTALVFDSVERELLVAEEGGVASIPASQLDTGLTPSNSPSAGARATGSKTGLGLAQVDHSGRAPVANSPQRGEAILDDFLAAPLGRLAVNQCNGNVYLSLEERGEILEYVRLTGALRVLADGLNLPGNLLGLYRRGVGCPDSFHLLVAERGVNRITLIIPEKDLVLPWLDLSGINDLTLIPPGGALAPGGGVLFAGLGSQNGEITLVRLPGLYRGRGLNTPRRTEKSGCVLSQETRTSEGNVRFASFVGDRLIFVSDADPTGENPDAGDEFFSVDRDGEISQLTDLSQGGIRDPALSADGTRVAFVSDGVLTTPDPPGDNLFVLDLVGGEVAAVPLVPEGGPAIAASGRFVAVASKSNPLGSNRDNNSEIFLIDTEAPVGQRIVQVTMTEGLGSRSPSLSDDGSILAFRSAADLTGENPDGNLYIFVYRRSGAGFVQVALERSPPGQVLETPIPLSGDGTRLAFVSQENLTGQNPGSGYALFVADWAEDSLRQVFLANRVVTLGDISRNGGLVAVTAAADPKDLNRDRNAEVFVVDLKGGNVVQLTRSTDAINLQPDFSSEGLAISILSNADYLGLNEDGNFEAFLFRCQGP